MPRKKAADKSRTSSKPRIPADRATVAPAQEKTDTPFPIVGLGASAGGLESLKKFFSTVDKINGMAYIVVVHMTRNQPSMMPELLQKVTEIPVITATDNCAIVPNHVYVVPPNKEINVYRGAIHLFESQDRGVLHPIDSFLRSLAQDRGRMAAAIILSGTGTDGSQGIKEINTHEGVVFAQDIKSAAYEGMPLSAINTGVVDGVLLPEEMPEELLKFFDVSTTVTARKKSTTPKKVDQQKSLQKIYAILNSRTGHDFSSYKSKTILRRISRRMVLNQIEDYDTYVRFLRQNPAEPEALFRDLLIGVTNFFRDAESFEVLKTDVLPGILEQIDNGENFRAWIPGCSTGEEAYSLAIILRELLDTHSRHIDLQMFGTDIDNFAINKAREGLFPATIANDLSEKRLKRFFIKEDDFYRIRNEIRDSVIFSTQDVIKDPPFSRLNMLCCRNLLIYLNSELQKRIIPLFHYSLKPGGILMLGASESIGGFTSLFSTVDKKWKIFRHTEIPEAMRSLVVFPSGYARSARDYSDATPAPPNRKQDISIAVQKAVLNQFAPTAILIDGKGEILHIQGRSGKYLEPPSGPPSQNILDLAREGLSIELSSALRAARSEDKPVTRKNISIKVNGDMQTLDLHVRPQYTPAELAGKFLVLFEGRADVHSTGATDQDEKPNEGADSPRLSELEKELQVTRNNHQVVVEELESSNEELKSINEELQSTNEELQSTNEEQVSSREELQSVNEELQTVNAELQGKVEELSIIQSDMKNLLNSTEIATIFVDNDLCVKLFTTKAAKIVNLIPSDLGRPLQHVSDNLVYKELMADIAAVTNNLIPVEKEVETLEGGWYKMRIMPYRTMDNRIDGAVLTFSSIAEQKKKQTSLIEEESSRFEKNLRLVGAAFELSSEPTALIDSKLKLVVCNSLFSSLLKHPEKKEDELTLMDIKTKIPQHAGLGSKLKKAIKDGRSFTTRSFALPTKDGEQRFIIHAQSILGHDGHPESILLRLISK